MGQVSEAGFAAAGSMERLYELLQATGDDPNHTSEKIEIIRHHHDQ